MARKKVTRATRKQETAKKIAAEPVKTTSAVKTAEEKTAPVANEVLAEPEKKTAAVGAVKVETSEEKTAVKEIPETKTPETKTTETKTSKEKTAEEKTAEKTTKKAVAKKTAVKKELKVRAIVEHDGKQVEEKEMIARVKKAWTKSGRKIGEIKSMDLYIKPQESAIYYVINGVDTGSVAF